MKQETLEKAAEEYSSISVNSRQDLYNEFIEGACWQEKRMYSEEEVYKILLNYQSNYPYANNETGLTKWFEQFKKK